MAESSHRRTTKKVAPEFTEIFLVEDSKYIDFIGAVRKQVIKFCTRPNGVLQPALPPEPSPPVPPIKPPDKTIPKFWFYVELRTKTSSITLAIRMDNLYLVGFRTPGGVWWEFGEDGHTHLLDDSARWLGFGGGYGNFIGNNDDLDSVEMDRAGMIGAVNYLAKKATMTLEPHADAKSYLVKLVVMVCDRLRFISVSCTVDAGFRGHRVMKLDFLQGKQVQKWDKISKSIIFDWADNPNATIDKMIELGIKDKSQAAKLVPLVKYYNKR